ncbi:hypothetical protein WG219_21580 [Ectopseudomonas mendocina]|uniref:Uncharacterized protein n=1 Tax=Ectopseudomonas mendocina TaxID=300 RepID=A0ABZ2RJR8_ECTME
MGFLLRQTAVVDAVFQGLVSAGEIRDWLEGIETLLKAEQPFYFVSCTLAGTEFDEDYRAIQALWYKQYKPAFRNHCRGIVRVARDAAEQARLDTPALHAAWGVPYFVTQDKTQGYQWIAQRMVNDETQC